MASQRCCISQAKHSKSFECRECTSVMLAELHSEKLHPIRRWPQQPESTRCMLFKQALHAIEPVIDAPDRTKDPHSVCFTVLSWPLDDSSKPLNARLITSRECDCNFQLVTSTGHIPHWREMLRLPSLRCCSTLKRLILDFCRGKPEPPSPAGVTARRLGRKESDRLPQCLQDSRYEHCALRRFECSCKVKCWTLGPVTNATVLSYLIFENSNFKRLNFLFCCKSDAFSFKSSKIYVTAATNLIYSGKKKLLLQRGVREHNYIKQMEGKFLNKIITQKTFIKFMFKSNLMQSRLIN